MIDNKTKFRPVVGEESKIKDLPFKEGWVYFASDTGKIFLDVDDERVTMGGSGASLFYFEEDKVIELPNGAYQLRLSNMLEGQDPNAIKEIDLIINTTTESFYRVSSVDPEAGIVEAELLTVGGGSGGGGGGGGGGESSTSSIKIEVLDSIPTQFVYGQDYNCRVVVTATDDLIVTLAVEVTHQDTSVTSQSYTVLSGAETTINIGKILKLNNNKITFRAFGDNSGTAYPRSFSSRNAIALKLIESPSFNPLVVQTGDASIQFRVEGQVNKTVTAYVDNQPMASADYSATISGTTQALVIPSSANIPHGVHTVRLVLTATLNSGATVTADPLEYEMAWAVEGDTTPIIWFPYGYKTQIENYDDYILQYRVYNPVSEESQMYIYRNGVQLPISPLTIESERTSTATQKLAFTDYELGTNIYLLTVGGASKEVNFEVVESTTRDMNIDTAGLVLNLDSTGRSNSENIQNRSIWKYQNIQAELKDFNWYNNGWIMDDDGRSCLRISNGASVEIPLPNSLNILNSRSLTSGLTFEFRFKVSNIREYATLIQRNTNYVYNEDAGESEAEMGTIDPTKRSVIGSFYNNTGILIGTQESAYETETSLVSARYKEDEIINVSFVIENKSVTPLTYIYINGITSGICAYTEGTNFDIGTNKIIFKSDKADIDLYKIRIYRRDLSCADIVKNYIVDIKNVNAYDINQGIIQYRSGENMPYLDYERLVNYNYNIINDEAVRRPELLSEPYMVVKPLRDSDLMPYYKGDKVPVNIRFVNPYLDYLWNNRENGVNNPLTNNPITEEEYLTGCPSFNYVTTSEGTKYANDKNKGQLNVQGTSSQGYPRRNFKWKASLKKDDVQQTEWTYTDGPLKGQSLWSKNTVNGVQYKEWCMDTTLTGSKVFTWKADYMESSSSFNTGMANFVRTLYSKHPLEDFKNEHKAVTSADLLRTTIYGFPFLLFQERADGSYEYIGRYNFNLDKDSNERYGFEDAGLSYVKDGEGNYLPFKQIAECWEFEHNRGGHCSAKRTTFDEVNPNTGLLTFMDDFDYRYTIHADEMDKILEDASVSAAVKNQKWLEWTQNLQDVLRWLAETNCDGQTEEVKTERLNKFAEEFEDHFDYEYCAIYFICTELLHMYDSRGKNMMWATWGPHKDGGDYVWYPVFYDMDTMFGINNSGVPTWDYDAEPTDQGKFSTSNHTLWQNFWACFSGRIKQTYSELVGTQKISYESLSGYFKFDTKVTGSLAMMGQRPMNAINLDEFYKYIAPAYSEYGFINTSGNTAYTSHFFYCLQGTRELQQELYFRNRLNYLNSKWQAGSYALSGISDQFQARYDANASGTSDKYLYGDEAQGYTTTETFPVEYDCWPAFNLRTFLKQYVFVVYDKTASSLKYSNGQGTVEITPYEADSTTLQSIQEAPNFTQQLIYMGGPEYVASLGDLSKFYLDELKLSNLERLEELIIGNDDDQYYNGLLTNLVISDGTSNPKKLLRKVVLTGLVGASNNVNLLGSEKIEEFRALRTSISGVTFSPGVQIHTLHLPHTIAHLTLVEPVALDVLLTSPKVGDEIQRGLYIERITDNEHNSENYETIHMNTLSVIGGSMGYSSYKILETVTKIKQNTILLDTIPGGYTDIFSINLENVKWSPYRQITNGETYVAADANNYKRLNGHYKLENYTYNADTWDEDILNGNIYLYNQDEYIQNSSTITNLDLLDTYISDYEAAMDYFEIHQNKSQNHFRSTSESATIPTLPVITGLMYVENGANAIDEKKLFDYKTYFPELNIICNQVQLGYTTRFVNIDESGKEVEFEKQVVSVNNFDPSYGPVYPATDPVKSNYIFEGWSLSKNGGEILTKEQIEALRYTSNQNYTFYSVWRIQSFTIRFLSPDGNHDEITHYTADYGTFLHEPDVIPYSLNESTLPATKRFKCIGWVLDYTKSYPLTLNEAKVNLVTLSAIMSQNNDRIYYPCFFEEDCRTAPTDSKFFTFEDIPGTNKCVCRPASGAVLQGKITIPTVYEGKNVVTLADFGSGYLNMNTPQRITHLYWYETDRVSSQLETIETGAFRNCKQLVYIDIPNTITEIRQDAFRGCDVLEMIDFSNLKNLVTIGNNAFNAAFGPMVDINLHFAGKTKNFGQYSFAHLGSSRYGELKFGDANDPVTFTDDVSWGAEAFQSPEGVHFQTVVFYYDPMITSESALRALVSGTYMRTTDITPSFVDVTAL